MDARGPIDLPEHGKIPVTTRYLLPRSMAATLCFAVALTCTAAACVGNALAGDGVSVAVVADERPASESMAPSSAPPAAERVITLAPHVTEMVFAAGAGDKVVATVTSSNYPPEALELPRVGDGLSINAEQLLTLQPDLIVGWQQTLALQKLMPVLSRLDIPVIYIEPRVLNDIPDGIEKLGQALGTQDEANSEAARLRQQLADLRGTYAHRNPVTVFIEVGIGPLYTLGNDTLTNDAIASCGGVNVFHDSAIVAPAVTIESVLAREPEVVIVAHASTNHVAQRAQYWKGLHLAGARNNHVYGVHPDMLVRPGPRLIQAMAELCAYFEQLRPDLGP